MTRWARVGNSQKHKTLPEDATPWEDFWKNRVKNSKDGTNKNKVKSGRIEKKKLKQKKKFVFDVKGKVFESPENENVSKFRNTEQESETGNITPNFSPKKETNEGHLPSDDKELSKKQLKKMKKRAKLHQLENSESNNVPVNIFTVADSTKVSQQEKHEINLVSPKSSKEETKGEHSAAEFQGLSKKQLKKAKKKAKLYQLKNTESKDVQNSNSSTVAEIIDLSQIDDKSPKEKDFQGKKRFMQKFENISNVADSTKVSQQEEHEINLVSPKSSKEKTNGEHSTAEFHGLSKKQLKKAKKKAKLNQLKNTGSKDVQDSKSSTAAEITELSQIDDKSPKEKDFQGKKKLFMQKLEQKRKQNGILLLPAKIERKLYIIKKRLREKGLPPAAIKEIARKERRKEELKFRKITMSAKPCFNCRQIGHLLAECPMSLGKSNQETGLCFKCGSAEHTSYKCPLKIEGYPLAKCFVCKEEGHISKDCPKNDHGVYIKGGKCGLCGNVNHLKKDCPTLKKKNNEEADIIAYTINAEKSVDAEIIPTDYVKADAGISLKKRKKAKLVKF